MNLELKKSYYYKLHKELIAQHPPADRDQCRLLQLDKITGKIQHSKFPAIVDLIQPDDVLVINTSKVIPARLYGNKTTGAKTEILLLRKSNAQQSWECLVKPANKLKIDDEIHFRDSSDKIVLTGKILSYKPEGIREIEFTWNGSPPQNSDMLGFLDILDSIGHVPLPPYIKRDKGSETDKDKLFYQTIYADTPGSAAAPTAGMHFTEDIMAKIAAKGVRIVPVILHIGIDTFRPVKADNIRDHNMHSEFCSVPEKTAEIINQAKNKGGRIFSVGTTVVRTVESFADRDTKQIRSGSQWSQLFIYPGFEFVITDGLLTNFHLPESSLLMLVSALGGYESIMKAYKEAVEQRYRFFSYGDAMLIT